MIRELIDPSYYNSGANSLKETFLANMYRIVSAATKELYRGVTPLGPLLWQAEADTVCFTYRSSGPKVVSRGQKALFHGNILIVFMSD